MPDADPASGDFAPVSERRWIPDVWVLKVPGQLPITNQADQKKRGMPVGQHRTGVYIVDDNDVVRRVLRGIIRQDESLSLVGEATCGESALYAIKGFRPELVCLDILLPGVSGLEVLKRIRESYPNTRVVMISGQSTSQTVKEAMALGANGFVVKPFNPAKVLRAIHAALTPEDDSQHAAANAAGHA